MTRSALFSVFALALAVRWAYAFGLYLGFGAEGLMGPDSGGYLVLAREFADAAMNGRVAGWQWFGPDLSLMPLSTWSLAAHVAVAGEAGALTFVLVQGLFDAGTCVLAALIAARLFKGGAHIAGYAAALAPTLIVLSGLVYTDTIFVFFAALGLYAALRWAGAPSWGAALGIGAAFGAAALARVLIVPFVPPLLVLLAAILLVRRELRWAGLAQLGAVALLVAIAVSPVLARNLSLYGAWSLTPQSGNHLANWILPLAKEWADGTPREKTTAVTEARMRERFGPASDNPFVNSQNYRAYAEEELGKLGFAAVARAWIFGAAINLASPAVVHVPPVSALPRASFYDTPGTVVEKLRNFLLGAGNRLYSWLLVLGLGGVALSRLIQLVGLAAVLRYRTNLPPLLILGGWCLYVLAINGPIASPKYRLPLEPALAVLTGAGLARFVFRRSAQT